MSLQKVLASATARVALLQGRVLDVLTLSKPASADAAANLAKVVSKLSPLLGNVIEFSTVEYLNQQEEFKGLGVWKRQDPEFPDAVFDGEITPRPGLEIKAWFPFATEITARFKNSQSCFPEDSIYVCMLAWALESLVFGKPMVIDVCIVSGRAVAEARDRHYHNPPDYLVLEPEDTSARTRNLQQTNVNGYKWQDSKRRFAEAQRIVRAWHSRQRTYSLSAEYQAKVRKLFSGYRYRLDTNFAKMDRIVQPEIESFKSRVRGTPIHGLKVSEWSKLFYEETELKTVLGDKFGIGRRG
jgi:hypothetical protein